MASKQRLFKISDITAVSTPTQLETTADGRLAAMVIPEVSSDGTRMVGRIWLLDESAREGARVVTVEDKDASMPQFSPDGRCLAYLSEQGEKKKKQIVVLTTPFSEPKVLTDFDEGVQSFAWMGGRSLLALAPPDKPETKKKAMEDKDDAYVVEADEPCARMWQVRLSGGKPKPIGPRDGHVCVASASADGKRVAYVHASHSTMEALWTGSGLHVLDARTGRSRLLRKCSSPHAAMWAPRFSPDGSKIVFGDSPRKGMLYPQAIFVVDVEGRRAVRVDRGADRTMYGPRWLDDRTILYTQQNATARTLKTAPASGGPGRDVVDRPGSVTDYVGCAKTSRVLFVYSEIDKPFEVYAVEREGAAPKCLTRLNAKLANVKHSRGEVVRWKSKEGWTVEGLFLRPTTNVRAPYATIMIPHGGPHGVMGNSYERATAQVFCAKGYAVFMPNFRGSTGYGEKFTLAIQEHWGKEPADDIVRGIKGLIRRRLVDLNRLVVSGGSYGGYMTAWLIGHYDYFRAAVAHAPVVNLISQWGTTDIPSYKEWSFDGSPLARYDRYWAQSPVRWLKGCRTPTLVITGDVDLRVPVGQSQELYRTVLASGVPAKLVRYPREPHGIGEPRHRIDVVKRTLAWFKEHLGKDSPNG